MKHLTDRQKTAWTLILILTLIAIAVTVFCVGTSYRGEYLYLCHVDENGFAARLEDGTAIFFEYPGADGKFQVFDTVRVVWNINRESPEVYTYPGIDPATPEVCDARVTRVISARRTLPPMEPVYG